MSCDLREGDLMPRPRGHSRDLEERRRKARRLLRSGKSPVQVASQLGVTTRTVRRWRITAEKGPLATRGQLGRPARIPRGVLLNLFCLGVRGPYHACWDTLLGRWIRRRAMDSFIRDLSAQGMRASRSTVYAWLSGRRWPRVAGIRLIARSTHGQLGIDDVFDHFATVARRRLPIDARRMAELIYEIAGVRYHIRHVRRLINDLSGHFLYNADHPGMTITTDAIYKWVAGTRSPSSIAVIQRLLQLSKGAVTLTDIADQRLLGRETSR